MVGVPRPSRVVKYLLLINIGVFVVQLLAGGVLEAWFGVTLGGFWQPWRYVTFQFLHSRFGLWHLGLNMLGLYMLGSPLERQWGARRFLTFYLSCGATAGVAYVLAGALVGGSWNTPLIGASGGVYGILLACAVLMPHVRIILLLFPVPIRLAAVLIFGAMALVLLRSVRAGVYSGQFWSDVAHMGGAAAAAVWLWGVPRVSRYAADARRSSRKGTWERKMRRRQDEEAEIDRILQKIHTDGISSLSRREKRTLQQASRRQGDEDRRVTRL